MLLLFVLFVFCLVLFCLSIVYFGLPFLLSLSFPSCKTVQSPLSLYKRMSSFLCVFHLAFSMQSMLAASIL